MLVSFQLELLSLPIVSVLRSKLKISKMKVQIRTSQKKTEYLKRFRSNNRYLLLCEDKTSVGCELCRSDVVFHGLRGGRSSMHWEFSLISCVLKIYFILLNKFPNAES